MRNAVTLLDRNGFTNSSAMRTFEGADASVTSIVPLPALRFPDHAYLAPTPESEPVKVRCWSGSRPSDGRPFRPRGKINDLLVDALRVASMIVDLWTT
jgi:hypothetical protein